MSRQHRRLLPRSRRVRLSEVNGLLPGGTPACRGSARTTGASPTAANRSAALQKEEQALAAAARPHPASLMQVPEFKTLRDQIEFTITSEGLAHRAASSAPDPASSTAAAPRLRGESDDPRVIARRAGQAGQRRRDRRPHRQPSVFERRRYGNWELSSDRANAARRVMEARGSATSSYAPCAGSPTPSSTSRRIHSIRATAGSPIVVRSQAAASLEQAVQSAH